MCDYSAKGVRSRAAVKQELLVSGKISHHTKGFTGVDDKETAVCLLPGTELAFKEPVRLNAPNYRKAIVNGAKMLLGLTPSKDQRVATFTQINKNIDQTHHDALQFVDGTLVMLNELAPGQIVTVVQLPADPSTLQGHERQAAIEHQRRAEYA